MTPEIVNYGSYAYRAYARKHDAHGVIWDACFDVLDGSDGRLLYSANVHSHDEILTTPEAASRLAEVVVRASIDRAMREHKPLLQD